MPAHDCGSRAPGVTFVVRLTLKPFDPDRTVDPATPWQDLSDHLSRIDPVRTSEDDALYDIVESVRFDPDAAATPTSSQP